MELVRSTAADRTGIGIHRTEFQTQAGENAGVGVVHILVFHCHAFGGEMEGIGIFHQELARTHHAEARTDFIAEFGLDLVKIDRQLFVRTQFVTREIGDDFFVGRAVGIFGFLAILDLQQLTAKLGPASGFFPQFFRLNRRHQYFNRAGTIHFFAHDGFHFTQHFQTERGPGVNAGRMATNHARAQH